MFHHVHFGRAALVAASLLLAAPAAALADGGPSFTIGPVKVKHGYTASGFGFGCGTASAGGSVSFSTSSRSFTESHSYTPRTKASCHVAGNLSSGSLKFRIGKLATVNVTFHKKGALKHEALPPGCTGPKPEIQPGVATGTIRFKIAPSFFGRVSLGKAQASVSKTAAYTCKPTTASKKTVFFDAAPGSQSSGTDVFASRPPGGPGFVSIIKSQYTGGVFQSHTLTWFGGSSFTANSDLSSASIKGSGDARGTLKFSATPSCKGSNRTGTVSGSITAHFDVVGNQTLKGGPSVYADLYKGTGAVPCSGH
jgi:hypothetical protein